MIYIAHHATGPTSANLGGLHVKQNHTTSKARSSGRGAFLSAAGFERSPPPSSQYCTYTTILYNQHRRNGRPTGPSHPSLTPEPCFWLPIPAACIV
jgi:hypothetical protein